MLASIISQSCCGWLNTQVQNKMIDTYTYLYLICIYVYVYQYVWISHSWKSPSVSITPKAEAISQGAKISCAHSPLFLVKQVKQVLVGLEDPSHAGPHVTFPEECYPLLGLFLALSVLGIASQLRIGKCLSNRAKAYKPVDKTEGMHTTCNCLK